MKSVPCAESTPRERAAHAHEESLLHTLPFFAFITSDLSWMPVPHAEEAPVAVCEDGGDSAGKELMGYRRGVVWGGLT